MQPFASSMIRSSGQASSAQPLRRSPSTPTSPNSLTISARRRPPEFAMMWRISVVLPAPRKPVTMVTGVLPSMGSGLRMKGRGARDDAPAEGKRTLAPRNDPVGRRGIVARGRHDVLEVRRPAEVADDIGPFPRRGQRDGAGTPADGEAFDRRHREVLTPGALGERLVETRAEHDAFGLAGHADEERRGHARRNCGRRGRIGRLPGRPSGGLNGHFRTAGLLARSVSPAPPSRDRKPSGVGCAGTPLTVAGAAAVWGVEPVPRSLFTLEIRGTVQVFV